MSRGLQPDSMAASKPWYYPGWPGQASSYKVGERAILKMRDRAKASSDFDLKQWYIEVLAVGSVGLDLMSERPATSAGR